MRKGIWCLGNLSPSLHLHRQSPVAGTCVLDGRIVRRVNWGNDREIALEFYMRWIVSGYISFCPFTAAENCEIDAQAIVEIEDSFDDLLQDFPKSESDKNNWVLISCSSQDILS